MGTLWLLIWWYCTKGQRLTQSREWVLSSCSPPTINSLKAQSAHDLCLCTSTHDPHLVQAYPQALTTRGHRMKYEWMPLIQYGSYPTSEKQGDFCWQVCCTWAPSLMSPGNHRPFTELIASCPIWLSRAEQWLSIWRSEACVALIPSGKAEIT